MEDVRIDSGELEKGKEQGLKYDYKINMNIMVGILIERFMDIVLSSGEELTRKRDEFNNEIKKYLVSIKQVRSFPRKKCIV